MTSCETLKSILKAEGVAYSTYNCWRKKLTADKREYPIAQITIRDSRSLSSEAMLSGVRLPGVTVAFLNGLKAYFGQRNMDSGRYQARDSGDIRPLGRWFDDAKLIIFLKLSPFT